MSDANSRGPAVWLDLDQAALDRAYDQTQFAANMQAVMNRYQIASERSRSRLGAPSQHRYGPGSAETLDRFMPRQASGPVAAVVFIHGGGWRGGFAHQYAFVADTLIDIGCAVLIPDFAPVTELGGDLVPMVDQLRRAMAWLSSEAESLGIDPDRIHLVGHSSGAHLAATTACTDWSRAFGLKKSPIASLTVCSGIYDLRPVRLSARSRYVTIDDASEEALSPIRHLAQLKLPLTIAWGELESPEFQRQATAFADAAEKAGLMVQRLFAQSCNHFEILETIASPHGLLGAAVVERVRSAVPADHAQGVAPGEDPDRFWMQRALEEARLAYDRGDWPTGAVLVKDGRLLSTGQNRQVTMNDFTWHAEPDAIRRAVARAGISSTQGATLYCTMEPCPMCAGALKLAGVTRVVLALRHATLKRTDLGSYALEQFCEMTQWHPRLESGVLEGEYLALRRRWGKDAVQKADG